MVESWISMPWDDDAEQYWIIYRYWDGIDKPEYWRFCPIEDHERDLKSGRFSNFEDWIDWPEANIKQIFVPHGKQRSEVIEWILNNIKGKWGMGIEGVYSNGISMNFKFDEEDAMAFKLTFSHLHYE